MLTIYIFAAVCIVFGIAGRATCTAFPGPDDDGLGLNSADAFLLVALLGFGLLGGALLDDWAHGGLL